MTRHSALLLWLERGLLAAGVCLGAWCAAVLVEAQFHDSLRPAAPAAATQAPLVITQTPLLPGDMGTSKPRPASAAAPATGTLLGRLAAPSVKMSTTILEGTDDATLRRGSGHIEDTPFPGQPGNVGIAGHRDTTFRPLRNIRVGDPLEYTTANRLYRYRITRTLIVGPDDVYVLNPTDHPTMTLVTCYPFEFVGHAPRRFIVQAQLVGEEARAADPGARTKAGR